MNFRNERPVNEAVRASQERQKIRAAEQKLKQELARKIIQVGYRALARELHPDLGGSKDAMTRLNEVRGRLNDVYGS